MFHTRICGLQGARSAAAALPAGWRGRSDRADERGQEELVGDHHELAPRDPRHSAKTVSAFEAVLTHVDLELLDECRGDGAEDFRTMVTALAQESLITFRGARAGILMVARQIEGKLQPGIETEVLGRCLSGPRFELHNDQEADHGVNFRGGVDVCFAEFLGELRRGQALEDRAMEIGLPALAEEARRGGIHLNLNPVRLGIVGEPVLWEVVKPVVVAHYSTRVNQAYLYAIRCERNNIRGPWQPHPCRNLPCQHRYPS